MSSANRLQYTTRDLLILRGLFESRVMTSAHMAALYFNGRPKAAAKRLRALKRARVIAERPRLPQQPAVLFLTKKGYMLFSQQSSLNGYPRLGWELLRKRIQVSPLTIQHELDVMSVKTAIVKTASHQERLSVIEFGTWPRLFQFRAKPDPSGKSLWMRPDAFVRIMEQQDNGTAVEHRFYLEVDRSSEALDILRGKAGCYLHHYQTGGMAAKFNRPPQEYKHFPFRTLWVFRTAERRNNAAEMFLANRPPILSHAWLTTMKELLADPLGSIWVRPIDYRQAIRGTTYDPTPSFPSTATYRRRWEREKLIAANVRRQAIFPIAHTKGGDLMVTP